MNYSKLYTAWSQERLKKTEIVVHSHKYYELVYYVSGNGRFFTNENAYTFKSGYYGIIAPYNDHWEIHYSDGYVICIEIKTNAVLNEGVFCDKNNEIYNILDCILTETKHQQPLYTDMIEAKTRELVTLLCRKNMFSNKKVINKDFKYAIKYLQENFHEKIVLYKLASDLNYSYDYFHHKFKVITSCSPKQYILKLRLEKAAELLKTPTISCTDISYRCGFSTSAQFSKLFKIQYGITPLQYKKKIENEQVTDNQTS